MKRWTIVLFVAAAGMLRAQPDLPTYMANLDAAIAQMQANVVTKPQPTVPLGLQVTPVGLNYFETQATCDPTLNPGVSGACVFNNPVTMIAYADANARAGIENQDMNIVLGPLFASAEYQAACVAEGVTCITSNSHDAGGLANLKALITHVKTQDGGTMTYALAPMLDSRVISACGLNGSSTLTQITNCYKPLIVAAAEIWPDAVRFTVSHEPTGVLALILGQTLSAANFATLVSSLVSAAHTAVPGLVLGVGAVLGESSYVSAWAGTANLSFGGLDIYGGNCDVSTYYASSLSPMLVYRNTITAAGLYAVVNEAARPRMCQLGGPAGESSATFGLGDVVWSAAWTGADDAWQTAFISWASANGFASIALQSSQAMAWYAPSDPTGTNTNGQAGPYETNLMSNLGNLTSTGRWHAVLQSGWSASLQGDAGITGVGGFQ